MKHRLHNSHFEEEENIVDLTPLIDVVFVVLIAFIIIAPMLEIDSVDLASSRAENSNRKSLHQPERLSLYVKSDNSIWCDKTRIAIDQLEPYLKKMKNVRSCKKLQLFHDRKAEFGIYQTIKNTAEKLDFEQLDVILKPS